MQVLSPNSKFKYNSNSAKIISIWMIYYFLGETFLKIIPQRINIFTYLLIGVFGLVFAASKKVASKTSQVGILICIVVNIMQLFSYLYNQNGGIHELLYVWGYMGISICISKFDLRTSTIRIIYYLISIILLIILLLGFDPGLLMRSSRNAVSGTILLYTTIYYYIRFRNNEKLTYIPVIISVLLSLVGMGRAGVLSSLFLLLQIFLYDFFIIRKIKIRQLTKFLVLIILVVFLVNHFFLSYLKAFLLRMDMHGIESVRVNIWQEYLVLTNSSFKNFIFGVANSTQTGFSYLSIYNENLHNSFLMLHRRYGIFTFLVFLVLSIKANIFWIKNQQYFYFILFGCISVRAFFDWCAFPGPYEILYYSLFIQYFENKRILRRKK